MRQFGKWVLTLGLVAATPALATAANPLGKLFRSQSPRTNQQVANDVAQALRSARLNRYAMDIEFNKGVCKLLGKIGTAEQKALATKVVSRVSGVKSVDNQLQIIAAAPAPKKGPFSRLNSVTTQDSRGVRRAAYTGQPKAGVQLTSNAAPSAPTNQQMAERIAKALQSAGLTGYDMEIRYQNGIAALGGSVSSPAHRAHAARIAERRSGRQGRQQSASGFPGTTSADSSADASAHPSGGDVPGRPRPGRAARLQPRWCGRSPHGLQHGEPAGIRLAVLRELSQLRSAVVPEAVQCERVAVHRPVLSVPAGSDGLAESHPRMG